MLADVLDQECSPRSGDEPRGQGDVSTFLKCSPRSGDEPQRIGNQIELLLCSPRSGDEPFLT